MKKFANFCMSLVLFFALWGDTIFLPSRAAEVYALWVNGLQITSENCTDILGNGTVSYDHSTKTLMLNNAEITKSIFVAINSHFHTAGIGSHSPLTIHLIGKNVIRGGDIFLLSPLKITGSGSLTVSGGSYAVHCSSITIDSATVDIHGLYAEQLSVTSGTVTVRSSVSLDALNLSDYTNHCVLLGASEDVAIPYYSPNPQLFRINQYRKISVGRSLALSENETGAIQVKAINLTDFPLTGKLFLASYDASGRQLTSQISDLTCSSNMYTDIDTHFLCPQGGTVKAFLLDPVTFTPLCKWQLLSDI